MCEPQSRMLPTSLMIGGPLHARKRPAVGAEMYIMVEGELERYIYCQITTHATGNMLAYLYGDSYDALQDGKPNPEVMALIMDAQTKARLKP